MRTGTDTNFQAVSRLHLNFEIQILLERGYKNDYIFKDIQLSQIILMAKFMRKRISKLHCFCLSGKLKTAWKFVSVLKYVPKTLVGPWQICWNRYLLYNPKYICNVCLIIYYLKATVAPAQLFFKQLLKQLWEE